MTINELVIVGSVCMIVIALFVVFITLRVSFLMRKFDRVHQARDTYYNKRFDIMEKMITNNFEELLKAFKN
jgi:archaellum component FlaF (FlaF/FlaG flagellin family)